MCAKNNQNPKGRELVHKTSIHGDSNSVPFAVTQLVSTPKTSRDMIKQSRIKDISRYPLALTVINYKNGKGGNLR